MQRFSAFTQLICPECERSFSPNQLQTFCQECASPILAKYDASYLSTVSKETIIRRERGIWRWHEFLPILHPDNQVNLGEGDSPIINAPRLGAEIGMGDLYFKDESGQPTGTFKARGLAMAVSKAIELGINKFVIPTAGNAGGALAAYCARAGKEANIFMPKDAPRINRLEVEFYGSNLNLVDGLIDEAGRQAREAAKKQDLFDVSTFKEPYRLEGKKTMGLELAEQFDWRLPDVIIYPTGGGTGLVGMWKAFNELEEIGWIDEQRPRLVSVQAAGCAPIVKAFQNQAPRAESWAEADTIAAGLRVPYAFADRLILKALRSSNGTAVAVSDDEIIQAQREIARFEGMLHAPEGAATYAALKKLRAEDWLSPDDCVVLYNTGTGIKYF